MPRNLRGRPGGPHVPPHAACAVRQVRVDMSLFALMRQFEKGRSHMALVVDAVRPSGSNDVHAGLEGGELARGSLRM